MTFMHPETETTIMSTSRYEENDVYDDGYLRLEHKNYYVACNGKTISLPRTEFLILSRLLRMPERIVSSQDLWRYAWGDTKPLNTESLHVYIYRLRHKLAPYQVRIDTMVNVGYRLIPALVQQSQPLTPPGC